MNLKSGSRYLRRKLMEGRFVHGAYIEPSWVKHRQPISLEERVKSLECHIDDIYEILLELIDSGVIKGLW
jgi:hypothetical protein